MHDGPPTDHMSRCRDYAVNIAIAGTSPATVGGEEVVPTSVQPTRGGDRWREMYTPLFQIAARDQRTVKMLQTSISACKIVRMIIKFHSTQRIAYLIEIYISLKVIFINLHLIKNYI